MARSIKVTITRGLLEKATTENSSKCMIAQALRHSGAKSVHVTAESASFNIDDMRYTYPLPAAAAAELIRFDENKDSVKPFHFVLDGRSAYARPVIKRPSQPPRGPTKQRSASSAKRCVRRFHGLRVIEASGRIEQAPIEGTVAKERILGIIKRHREATIAQIRDELGMGVDTKVGSYLGHLSRTNQISRTSSGSWKLA